MDYKKYGLKFECFYVTYSFCHSYLFTSHYCKNYNTLMHSEISNNKILMFLLLLFTLLSGLTLHSPRLILLEQSTLTQSVIEQIWTTDDSLECINTQIQISQPLFFSYVIFTVCLSIFFSCHFALLHYNSNGNAVHFNYLQLDALIIYK